jgi:hypothetical protein
LKIPYIPALIQTLNPSSQGKTEEEASTKKKKEKEKRKRRGAKVHPL